MKNIKKLICTLALSLPFCSFAMDKPKTSNAFPFGQDAERKTNAQTCKEAFSHLDKTEKLMTATHMSRTMSPKSLIAVMRIFAEAAAAKSKNLTSESTLPLLHTQQAITNMLMGTARQAQTETIELKESTAQSPQASPSSVQNTPKRKKKNKNKRQSLVSNGSESDSISLAETPDKTPRTLFNTALANLKAGKDTVQRESLYITAVSPINKKRESTASNGSLYTSYRSIRKSSDVTKSHSAENTPRGPRSKR